MTSYCVRCRSKTQDKNPRMKQTSNGRQMIQSTCAICNTTKCKFESNKTGKTYQKGKKTSKKLRGKGPIGSLIGSLAGSLGGAYLGSAPGMAVGSQLGQNLGDLLPF